MSNSRPVARTAPTKATRAKRMLVVLIFAVVALLMTSCTAGSLRGSSNGWSPALSMDDTVYVGTKQGEVKALEDNGFDGIRVKWTFCVREASNPGGDCEQGLQGVYDTPKVGPDLIYVTGIDGYLYGIDKETGTFGDKGWRRAVGSGDNLLPLVSGPVLDIGRGIVLVASENGSLYAFDARPRSGQAEAADPLKWTFLTGDRIWSTPVLRGGVAYFGSHDHNVYAVDMETGDELWRFGTGGAVAGRLLLVSDLVVAGSFDKTLYGINASDGTLRWRFEGNNWFWAGAVADSEGSTIYAPSMDGNIYALDRNGNLLWKHDMGASIVSRPVLVPRGLVVAAKNGNVSLLSTARGSMGPERVISSLRLQNTEVKAPLFAAGDSVFVGAQNSTVTRIDMVNQREVWCFKTNVPRTAIEYRDIRCD